MKTPRFSFKVAGMIFLLFMAVNGFAQFTTIDEAKDFINDHLSHSILQKIDPDGTVTMGTPSEKIKFNLHHVTFNYNGGNNDDRVRVAGDNCIERYEHKILTEKTSRQSFLCESENDAMRVIDAFRFLKKRYTVDQGTSHAAGKALKTNDTTFNTKTVTEAIDFINENLTYSVITGVDEAGIMTINSPDETFQVDLAKAEFGYNDASDGSKVRIYGDFCISDKKGNGDRETITRKSFQTQNRVKAYKAITVLYYLKSTYANLDPAKIRGLKNLTAARVATYSTPEDAIDYINARLLYSIILDIDHGGNLTMNAPEEIYRFNINEVKITSALNTKSRSEWFPIVINNNSGTGILVEGHDGISKYDAPGSYDKMDEQVFQCGSASEVRDVLKAFAWIRNAIKK
ncbi:MAG: hypothetical protein WCO44_00150 [Bacteroidota bacterium]